jgi:hypothetical protein
LVSSQVMRFLPAPNKWDTPKPTLADLDLLTPWPVEEENPTFWNQKAAEALNTAKKLQPIQTAAKNLILFLGDGERARPAPPPRPSHACTHCRSRPNQELGPDRVLFLQEWR